MVGAAARAPGRSSGRHPAGSGGKGRWPALVQHCYPDTGAEELPQVASATLEMLLNLAAVRSGAAQWQHSWSEPVKLCRNDGEPLDLSGLAAAPETLPEARSRLSELGIDADARASGAARAASGRGIG
jgi:hypothetical protein